MTKNTRMLKTFFCRQVFSLFLLNIQLYIIMIDQHIHTVCPPLLMYIFN